jgi:hypothetical protein
MGRRMRTGGHIKCDAPAALTTEKEFPIAMDIIIDFHPTDHCKTTMDESRNYN